ncbi:MAG: DUF4301 family protein [Syntrophaceae bacterium]|nr:DUF4301 family protein [Syntrophaceae bacterium]
MRELKIASRLVHKQILLYFNKTKTLSLNRECKVRDGIYKITVFQKKKIIQYYEQSQNNNKIVKFVPASGAASRMFAHWHNLAKRKEPVTLSEKNAFLRDLKKMPFYPLIKKDERAKQLIIHRNIKELLNLMLSEEGFNLTDKPKALILFHRYSDINVRTALEEHLYEAGSYCKNVCRVHFTISPEHRKSINEKINEVIKQYEKKRNIKYKIDLSYQSSATNIIAVDYDNKPLRDKDGKLIFRPGGHGALLENLNKLEADLIFIKNIDNIVPEILCDKIIPYKKMLGGLALQTRDQIFDILRRMEVEKIDKEQIELITQYCKEKINIVFPPEFYISKLQKRKKIIFSLLNRPLRVCAMVRNTGEPGGGPFWVEENNKTQTLQIVEYAHVNKKKASQMKIWSQSVYFNPVDIACCIKNYQGKIFDLKKYVNKDTYLITSKTEKGRTIKVQEMPGLWNGSMHYWNTIFVEFPLITFNPVKTVYDLLRPQHQKTKS